MWSLIIIACIGTDDGVACHEVKWHLIESKAECLRMRNWTTRRPFDQGWSARLMNITKLGLIAT